jgi:hypothetical protein
MRLYLTKCKGRERRVNSNSLTANSREGILQLKPFYGLNITVTQQERLIYYCNLSNMKTLSGYFIGSLYQEDLLFPPVGQLLFFIRMLHVTRNVQED